MIRNYDKAQVELSLGVISSSSQLVNSNFLIMAKYFSYKEIKNYLSKTIHGLAIECNPHFYGADE